MHKHPQGGTPAQSIPEATPPEKAPAPCLEKVAQAAKRMAVSRTHFYREVAAGRITLVKIGARAVAVQSSEVDAWIDARVKGQA